MSRDTNSPQVALAVGCHPDDIEFMMAGTLFRLREKGFSLHYMNVANGNCGTLEYGREEIEVIRRKEAQSAAEYLGATWYPSIANDLEVVYDIELVRKVLAVMRTIGPDIILVPALHDYMEDHMNTARIAVTAAFTLAMPNFVSIPPVETVLKEVALYHAMPYGLHDTFSRKVVPHFYVDTTNVIESKERMLACHTSQRNWLDDSQKLDSYVRTMVEMGRQMGSDSGRFSYAEGWLRHNPLGYSGNDYHPLETVLSESIVHVEQ